MKEPVFQINMSALNGDLNSKFGSLNVNAAVFVPSWASPSSTAAPQHPTDMANSQVNKLKLRDFFHVFLISVIQS